MATGLSTLVVVAAAQALGALELSLDQKLILACYKVRVEEVVSCLRKGANVNARFGDGADDVEELGDRWTGAVAPVSANEWTALNALASCNDYPDPPADAEILTTPPNTSRTG